MGVDAMMCVRLPQPPTQREITILAWRLREAFPSQEFSVPALTRMDQTKDTPLGPVEDHQRVLVANIWWRFYAPGYERGPAVSILAVARWLEDNTGGQVFYGNDADDAWEEFGQAERDDLWRHFVKYGHVPYYAKQQSAHACANCADMPMISFARHKGMVLSKCAGCDSHTIHGDGELRVYATAESANVALDALATAKQVQGTITSQNCR